MLEDAKLACRLWKIWGRIGEHWCAYFQAAGLDLCRATEDDLLTRLRQPIQIAFGLEGLEELSQDADKGIEPGDPARSLFYHVLASPHCTPWAVPEGAYPRMEELDIIENCVYSAASPTLEDLYQRAPGQSLAIAVFAYEYAAAIDTVHGRHADLCFSRTGIARVGNARPNYLGRERGFFPASGGKGKVHAVPARYGVFLAAELPGNKETIGPMLFTAADASRKFWIPLHKLFNGEECIAGLNIELEFRVRHINEKIKKVHLALQSKGIDTGWNARQMQCFPFVIADDEAVKEHKLAEFFPATGLIVPVEHDPMVEPAMTLTKGEKERKYVGFPVPHDHPGFNGTLWFKEIFGIRQSPEFVHAKHAIRQGPDGNEKIVYIPTEVSDIGEYVKKGGYEAANFVDWTADGFLRARCPTLAASIHEHLAAYSILAQPDFFPQVKQQDITEWWEHRAPKEVKDLIWPDQGIVPNPLAEERLPVNFTLDGSGFHSKDTTLMAIVGMDRKPGRECRRVLSKRPRRESTLSYRATNLFEPGWDASEDCGRDALTPTGVFHLANYGLGSPYPEDTLICAASGAFWPGAVPDVTRFFTQPEYPSSTPILDSQALWDSVPLPRKLTATTYEYISASHADYVEAIYRGGQGFRYEEFAEVTLDEYILRTLVTARVFQFLAVEKAEDRAKYPFLSFDRAKEPDLAVLQKHGWKIGEEATFRVQLGEYQGVASVEPPDPKKIVANLRGIQVLFAGPSAVAAADPAKPGGWIVHKL
jgi:hypothetical protein